MPGITASCSLVREDVDAVLDLYRDLDAMRSGGSDAARVGVDLDLETGLGQGIGRHEGASECRRLERGTREPYIHISAVCVDGTQNACPGCCLDGRGARSRMNHCRGGFVSRSHVGRGRNKVLGTAASVENCFEV